MSASRAAQTQQSEPTVTTPSQEHPPQEMPEVIMAATALQVHTPASQEVAVFQQSMGGFTGSEDMTMADLVVPRYKIVQPTSRKGEAGCFYKSLTEESVPAIDAIVIRNQKGRAMWEANNMEAPVCRSNDYFHPDPRIENPKSPICCDANQKQLCPYGEWTDKKTPPPCGMTYNLLCIDRDEMMPFWITLHGKNIEPIKRLNTTAQMRGKGKYYIFDVTLTLEQQINDKGKFFVVKISPPVSRYLKDTVTPIDPEQEIEYLRIIQMCGNVSLQKTFDAEEEMSEGAEREPGSDEALDGQGGEGEPGWMKQ